MAVALLPAMSDLTHVLDRVQQGDPRAAGELLPLVYEELRQLASAKMARESAGHTLLLDAWLVWRWLSGK